MRDALQAGMHADSKFKSRQKMNAAKNIQRLNNISAERLVSPIWARFSLLEIRNSSNKKIHCKVTESNFLARGQQTSWLS